MLNPKSVCVLGVAASLLVVLCQVPSSARGQAPNPTAAQMANARANGPCTDPWVTLALWNATGGTRKPNGVASVGECDPKLYGGSWNNYNDLLGFVQSTLHSMSVSASSFYLVSDGRVGGTSSILMVRSRVVKAIQTISNNVISNDGASIARLVASGAGNLVASGAGNFTVGSSSLSIRSGQIMVNNGANLQAIPSFSFSNGYRLASVDGGLVLPKTTLVIR